VALGLAIANKEWALLAVGPVLLALPSRRVLCMLSAGAVGALVLAPLALVSSGGFVASARVAATPPAVIFQPWQAFWFLGHHGALVHGLFGAPKPGYRTGPAWTNSISHPLIIALGVVLPMAQWLQRRRRAGASALLRERDALLALALLLLLRCVLDTWDISYYLLPLVFALLAWEVSGPPRRPPVLALSSTVLMWVSCQWLPAHGASPDIQAAFFLAWSLPLAGALGLWLYAPGLLARRSRKAQEMTVSSLGRLVRTS
jgi:hypothetical protein